MLRDMKFPIDEDQPRLELTPFARQVIATCNRLLCALPPNTRPRDFIVSSETYERLADCYDTDVTSKADVAKFMSIMGVLVKTVDCLMHGDEVMLRVWKQDYFIEDIKR